MKTDKKETMRLAARLYEYDGNSIHIWRPYDPALFSCLTDQELINLSNNCLWETEKRLRQRGRLAQVVKDLTEGSERIVREEL